MSLKHVVPQSLLKLLKGFVRLFNFFKELRKNHVLKTTEPWHDNEPQSEGLN